MHRQKKKRHHFVWRKYLRSWSNNESIFCRMGERIFPTNLMNIGQEKYFYRLKELKAEEITFLKQFIEQSQRPMLRTLNDGWVSLFDSVFRIRDSVRESGKSNGEIEELLDVAICNFEEEIHSKVETDGEYYLDLLYDRDLSFWESDEELIPFLHYLCLQYFRTQRMAANLQKCLGDFRGFNIEAMWAVLRHISATNVGWVLFAERNRHFPVLLSNETGPPFITGDQPVINTFAVGLQLEQEPDDLEFYYPLSPKLALLVTKDAFYRNRREVTVGESEVNRYNASMFDQSGRQLYASERDVLENVRGGG